MPPDGDADMNVAVRGGKVKGETECRADRTVSTGGYAATKKRKENLEAGFIEDMGLHDYCQDEGTSTNTFSN